MDGAGSAPSRRELAEMFGTIAVELRRIAEDPALKGPAQGRPDETAPLSRLLRDVGAALDVPVTDEPDLERLATRLDDLLEHASGRRARQEEEWMARIHRSAEEAIARALREHGDGSTSDVPSS
jgi:hypothetical protein